jgi:hypothetical protein
MVQLESIHQQLVLEIQERLAVVASGARAVEISETFRDLSRNLQALAICHLLESADQDEFRANLERSGQARRHYLRKSRDQGNAIDRNLALSRTEAFFDSVAAGDLSLSKEIADLSVTEWNADWEYEDDFCYYSFLHDLLRSPGSPGTTRLGATLNRFETALEGVDSPRLNVCSALLARKEDGFIEAFQALLESIREASDKRREVVESYDLTFWPRSFISVEALAVLRIAELRGIRGLERDFALCPALAKLPVLEETTTSDLFEEIERNITITGT